MLLIYCASYFLLSIKRRLIQHERDLRHEAEADLEIGCLHITVKIVGKKRLLTYDNLLKCLIDALFTH